MNKSITKYKQRAEFWVGLSSLHIKCVSYGWVMQPTRKKALRNLFNNPVAEAHYEWNNKSSGCSFLLMLLWKCIQNLYFALLEINCETKDPFVWCQKKCWLQFGSHNYLNLISCRFKLVPLIFTPSTWNVCKRPTPFIPHSLYAYGKGQGPTLFHSFPLRTRPVGRLFSGFYSLFAWRK